MRVLHTADWHLGRTFHGASLLDAQERAMHHTIAVAEAEGADAILISGDIFDRALPPREAVELWDEALTRMAGVCPVVLISGNHDSPSRLGYGSALLQRADVHVRTQVASCADPILVGGTAIYAIPFLEPDLVRHELGCDGRGHEAVLAAAMDRVRADLARRGADRAIVMAHAFITGAAACCSERDLTVGGSPSAPLSVFEGVDYVALGHLHGPQQVGGFARYSGSPVAFSFSEAGQQKSVAIVDLADPEPVVTTHVIPVLRPLALLEGELASLLADPAHAQHEGAWVHATLTDAITPRDAMARLRERFPHTAELRFKPAGRSPEATGSYASRLTGVSDAELVERFVEDVRGVPATEAERALLGDALAARRAAEAAA